MPRQAVLPIAPAVPDSRLLAAVLREVVALRADIAELRAANLRTAKTDDGAWSTLLHAIAIASNGLTFTVAELLLHLEVVAGSAADQRLHDAMRPHPAQQAVHG